jgi:ATPase subunit of ABC transporter with duplicated ATPase domains
LNDNAPLLQLIDACAGYSKPVVGPISLEIRPGEILGLRGSNGVGKTTLLRLVTGGAQLFGGELRRAPGLTVAHHRQQPERPPELPLTGRELLALAGVVGGVLPERLGVLATRCLDEMSGGEFQLLHAWACLAGPARLVLLDEPTNNLDQDAIELLIAGLAGLQADRAVLIVSHEAAFLEATCHRTVPLCP